MTVGETLLKITDYPFAYSLVGILTLWIGIDVPDDKFTYLLAISGSLGTLLVISNPIGRYLANTLKHNFGRRKIASFQSNQSNDFKYCIRAIETNSIKTEINKIVSLMYFALIIAIFGFAVGLSETLRQSLIFYQDNIPLCDSNCLMFTIPPICTIFLGILLLVLVKDWPKVIHYAEIAGVYQLSISSEFVTSVSRSNMGKVIEQNDWPTAEEWAKIIETEIKTEKGKKDFNIEAINQIYRPLYEESIQNDVAAKNILENKVNTTFSSKEWDHIQLVTRNLMIKDQNLINKIDLLYAKIKDYNQFPPTLENQIKSIIHREATKFYGMNVDDVHYYFRLKTSGSSPALWDCLRAKQHPLERNTSPYDYRVIELRTSDKSSKELKDPEEVVRFDELWDILLEKVDGEINLSKLEEQVKEIQSLNNELKPVFEEKIKKQWL
ncbi:MAG: hypothetical protein ACW9W3_01040 [Candidatus Nitrosopumilus sp. bin_68KS]